MSAKKSNSIPSEPYFSNYEFNIDGVLQADMGKYEKALEYFNKAIEKEPDNFISYFNRASVKMKLGDIDGAIIDFRKCGKLDKSDNLYA